MKRAIQLLALFAAACSSSTPATRPATVIPPVIELAQTSTLSVAASRVGGPITVQYKVRVLNRSSEVLTVDKMEFSVLSDVGGRSGRGELAYTFDPAVRDFNRPISPDHYEDFNVQMPATALPEQAGSKGPVTVRLITWFETPVGNFTEESLHQINNALMNSDPE